ncbi:MAG: hypothetical protein IPG55_16655 [Saprospiraceae bacterium]|nr:hypothetical protein [Candidatus Defluviibacterium haderslevense]
MTTWEHTFNANTDILTGLGLTKLAKESIAVYKERVKEKANDFISKYNSSSPTTFSLAKGDHARRQFKIPNPKHFFQLSKLIADNWHEISKIYLLSEFFESLPIIDCKSRAFKTYSKSINDFRERLAITSYNRFFEVRAVISKFYLTIYTHSITWTVLGKEDAKKYFNLKSSMKTADWKTVTANNSVANLYETSNNLDIALRACLERQTIRIPIGSDTSHIIAELISCRLNNLIRNKFKIKLQVADTISILIIIDMREQWLLNGTPYFSLLNTLLKTENLTNENWLLVYESVKKGWLIPSITTLLNDNHYFKILSDNNVDFYDTNKQLGIIELPKKKKRTAVFLKIIETEYFSNDIPSNFVLNGGE